MGTNGVGRGILGGRQGGRFNVNTPIMVLSSAVNTLRLGVNTVVLIQSGQVLIQVLIQSRRPGRP